MTRGVIVCAFEPFGGRRRNRSLDAARRLGDVVVLPVSFARLPGAIAALFAPPPAALLLCGEHGAAGTLRVERRARNRVAARIADNDGRAPAGALRRGGPAARRATWRARAICAAIRRAGVAARLSDDAGAFACNAALYLALAEASRRGLRLPIGFVHVPADRRRMPIATVARGLAAARDALAREVIAARVLTSSAWPGTAGRR